MGAELDYGEIEDVLARIMGKEISFGGMVQEMLEGGSVLSKGNLPELLGNLLLEQLKIHGQTMGHLLLLIISAAFIATISKAFRNRQISDMGFYMIFLLLFLIASFVIRQLDYIWHGFHFTNMIPYRFSFLISFILIVMAFRAFTTIDSISVVGALIATAMSIAVILMMVGDPGTEKMFTDHPDWQIPNLIAIAALTVFIAVVVILYTKCVIPKTVMIIALMVGDPVSLRPNVSHMK